MNLAGNHLAHCYSQTLPQPALQVFEFVRSSLSPQKAQCHAVNDCSFEPRLL
jgi:hypothetical protein